MSLRRLSVGDMGGKAELVASGTAVVAAAVAWVTSQAIKRSIMGRQRR
jgi:hypothetical protein